MESGTIRLLIPTPAQQTSCSEAGLSGGATVITHRLVAAVPEGPADRTASTGDQNSHRTSLFSSLCGDSRAFLSAVF
jgi:hypothetical protein